jgi:hypothetical protein
VIAEEPEFMNLEEQTELFAQRIKKLGRFEFLLRPAIAEGHIGSAVVPLSIRHEDIDKETGKYQYPDSDLIQRLRAALAKQSGIPIARLLKEQENRVPPSLPEAARSLTIPQRQVPRRPAPPRPPVPVSPPEPPQKGPERTADVKKPAALRRRHRIV